MPDDLQYFGKTNRELQAGLGRTKNKFYFGVFFEKNALFVLGEYALRLKVKKALNITLTWLI
jgi:hypothetical protein